MLSPNVDTALNMLTDVYTDFLGISNYDATCNSLYWPCSKRSKLARRSSKQD